jgi:hypothetical protein
MTRATIGTVGESVSRAEVFKIAEEIGCNRGGILSKAPMPKRSVWGMHVEKKERTPLKECEEWEQTNMYNEVNLALYVFKTYPRYFVKRQLNAKKRIFGSYGLKHVLERMIDTYISNGAAIIAAKIAGFDIKKFDYDNINCLVYIDTRFTNDCESKVKDINSFYAGRANQNEFEMVKSLVKVLNPQHSTKYKYNIISPISGVDDTVFSQALIELGYKHKKLCYYSDCKTVIDDNGVSFSPISRSLTIYKFKIEELSSIQIRQTRDKIKAGVKIANWYLVVSYNPKYKWCQERLRRQFETLRAFN